MGTGGWVNQAGDLVLEPTWVVQFRGDDPATLRRIAYEAARPAGRADLRQDAAMIATHVREGTPGAVPRSRLHFEGNLSKADEEKLAHLAREAGVPGWTFDRRRSTLVSNPIPSWGHRTADHVQAIARLSKVLDAAGYTHALDKVWVSVSMMETGGENSYERWIERLSRRPDARRARVVGRDPDGGAGRGAGERSYLPQALRDAERLAEESLKGEWDEAEHPRGRTVEGTNTGSFAPAGGGTDSGGRGADQSREPQAALARPVSLDRLGDPRAVQQDWFARTGTLTPGADTTNDLKIYPLQPFIDDPAKVEQMLADTGFRVEVLSFENDPEKGIEFRAPNLKTKGYVEG
jgi:hypothetical protein